MGTSPWSILKMNLSAILLVILSSLLHAVWSLIYKNTADMGKLVCGVLCVQTCLLIPFIIWGLINLKFSLGFCIFLTLSAVSNAFYYVFFTKAYSTGDIALTYPIIRAVPVLIMIGIGLLIGETPSQLAVYGMLAVCAGMFFLPLKTFRIERKHYFNISILWAGLAAFTACGYIIGDKFASKELCRQNSSLGPIIYLGFEYAGSFIVYLCLFRVSRKSIDLIAVFKGSYRKIVLIALIIMGTYLLILFAYQMMDVAYVIALRQFSIIWTAVLAVIFLRERVTRIRFIATVIIFAGLITIILSK
jgi:uncharacterized membrane protein